MPRVLEEITRQTNRRHQAEMGTVEMETEQQTKLCRDLLGTRRGKQDGFQDLQRSTALEAHCALSASRIKKRIEAGICR